MICRIFASDVFHRFWKFKMDDIMAAILYVFYSGTLTVAILLRFSLKYLLDQIILALKYSISLPD